MKIKFHKVGKILTILLIIFILIVIFSGFLFRVFINYSTVSVRNNIALTNKKLISKIDKLTYGKVLNINKIIDISNNITCEELNFTTNKISSNPNIAFECKQANCIGYSSLFNSIGNYLIKKQKLNKQYEFIHWVGHVDFMGFNIHKLSNNSFLRDHDFNEVKNKITQQSEFIDPSLNDYFCIDKIKCKQNKP